jgi:hypothetical protein
VGDDPTQMIGSPEVADTPSYRRSIGMRLLSISFTPHDHSMRAVVTACGSQFKGVP